MTLHLRVVSITQAFLMAYKNARAVSGTVHNNFNAGKIQLTTITRFLVVDSQLRFSSATLTSLLASLGSLSKSSIIPERSGLTA